MSGGRLPSPWMRLMCRFGLHKRLHIIQSFGAAKHVGCPDCRREFGMHDGLQAFLPWDGEFEDLYESFGIDVKGARERWIRRLADGVGRAPRPPVTGDAVPGMPSSSPLSGD